MIRIMLASSALALLGACGDGQPFPEPATTGGTTTDTTNTTDTTAGDGGTLDTGGATPPPPGTDSPEPDKAIFRYEAANGSGGGLVTDVSYNKANDTFTVDNLGFDGANVYKRNAAPLNTLGVTRVFAADGSVDDFLTGKPVGQVVPYRALYGVSKFQVDGEPRTSFAVVRTGGYVDYGFGGYVYERNGGVTIPTTGQATFTGDYAGMRVFQARGGMEYTTGDMTVDIDFEDFNANDAVKGRITNRRAFDENGVAVTLSTADGQLQLPTVLFVIQEGATSLDANGEIQANMSSTIVNAEGALETYETGTFNGIMAGDTRNGQGGEIVGVITLESDDPRWDGVKAQETGGVILYR